MPTRTTIKIRAARPQDAPDRHANAIHPAAAAGTLSLPSRELAEIEASLAEARPGAPRLVAEVDGRAVGSIGLHRSANPRLAHRASLGMSVHPDHWGRGIGRALLEALLDLCDNWLNLLRVELDVFTDNERAIRLYESTGFVAEGVKRRYAYGAGRWSDALVMARLRPPGDGADAPPPAPRFGERARSAVDPAAVRVRPFHPDDIPAVYRFFYRPEVTAGTAQTPLTDYATAEARFRERRDGLYRFVAEVDGRAVGLAGLYQPQNPRQRHLGRLGMSVDPDYWGAGIGGRLMSAIVDLADNWLNLERLELEVNTDNDVARRLYERFGFEREGTMRYHLYGDGRWLDSDFMGRLRLPETF